MVLRRISWNIRECWHGGFSILVERDETLGAIFLIQSLAVDKVNEEALKDILRPSDFPVGLAVETGLAHCPWCGVDLKRFYGKRVDELVRPGFSIPLGPSTHS